MIGGLKKVMVTLAMTLWILPLITAIEARATAEGFFTPVVEPAGPASSVTPVSAQPPIPVPAPAPALTQVPAANKKIYKGEKISLEFQKANLYDVIKIIGDVSGKNVIVPETVSGKVTLKLVDMPWDQALDIVLASRNLGVEESGNVLTIYDLPTLNRLRAERNQLLTGQRTDNWSSSTPLMRAAFTPQYASVWLLRDELDKLKSKHGKIEVMDNAIQVEDDPAVVQTMKRHFERLDRESRPVNSGG